MKKSTRRIALALTLVLLFSFTLFACSNESTTSSGTNATTAVPTQTTSSTAKKVFRYGYPENVQFWDPADNFNIVSYTLENCIYDTLVRYDPEDGKFLPSVATEWSTQDASVWNFKLRNDITFHNGEKLNASSVKGTIERFLTEKTLRRGSDWKQLVGVDIVNDYEINLKFSSPVGTCLNTLCFTPIIPFETFKKLGKDLFNNPIGSGPFKFTETAKDQYVILSKNDAYWGEKAKVDQIKYLPIMEDSTRVAGLQTGDLDAVAIIPSDQVPTLSKDTNLDIVTMGAVDQIYLGFKCDQAPFNDIKAREAVSLAIDREMIATGLFSAARAATCGIPEGCIGFDPSYPAIKRDVAKAKQLLSESSYSGETIQVILPLGWYSKTQDVGQMIQANLQEIGMKVNMQYLEGAAFAEKRAAGNYQIYYTGASFVGYNPDSFYFQRVHDDAMKTGYVNEILNAAIVKSRAAPTIEERVAQYKIMMDEMLKQTAPHTYIYQQEVIYGKRKNVTGIVFTRDRVVDLRYVDFSN